MRTIRILLLNLLLFIACLPAYSAEDLGYGITKQGAFILSLEPDVERNGGKRHSLTGYLPVGTVVKASPGKNITHIDTYIEYPYYYVESELGFAGLVREDLIELANGRKLAVVVSNGEISLDARNTQSGARNPKIKITRSGGHYLEVMSDSEANFYDVVLHRGNTANGLLPATEEFRLFKKFVEENAVNILDPDDTSLEQRIEWSFGRPENVEQNIISELAAQIREQMADYGADQIGELLSTVNDVQCLLAADGNAELGFKVFSTGLALKLNFDLMESGSKYIFNRRYIGNPDFQYEFLELGVVECNGSRPVRLSHLALGETNLEKRFYITADDIEKTAATSPWINTLQGEEISEKMVRINSWEEYNALITLLEEYAASGQNYLATVPEDHRRLLLNFIVSRISYFVPKRNI
jgi:hypothetical protein